VTPTLTDAPWLTRPATQAVFAAIEAGGHQVRAVGGAVRNTLLGRPVADVDMATTALPEQTMAAARAAGLEVIATGLQHGTVTVVSGRIPHEVTTLRADVATDGRHATVAFTCDWAADAGRRDLTINALYCDSQGKLYDPLGGLPDLEARRVRFIGDPAARIAEDYLRILRFFRFHAEYAEGPPDAAGAAASVAGRAGFKRLSGERIHHELLKLIAAPGALGALTVMAEHGLLTELLPVVPRLGVLSRLIAVEATCGGGPDAPLRLAALTIGVGEDAVRLNRRLKLSAREQATLDRAAVGYGHPFGLDDAALERRLYRQGPDVFREQLLFAWALSGQPPASAAWAHALRLPSRWPVPAMPVKAADVMALGVPAGPMVGRVLRAFEAWWTDARFPGGRHENARKLAEIVEREKLADTPVN
jgi:poly(A) polymerase